MRVIFFFFFLFPCFHFGAGTNLLLHNNGSRAFENSNEFNLISRRLHSGDNVRVEVRRPEGLSTFYRKFAISQILPITWDFIHTEKVVHLILYIECFLYSIYFLIILYCKHLFLCPKMQRLNIVEERICRAIIISSFVIN